MNGKHRGFWKRTWPVLFFILIASLCVFLDRAHFMIWLPFGRWLLLWTLLLPGMLIGGLRAWAQIRKTSHAPLISIASYLVAGGAGGLGLLGGLFWTGMFEIREAYETNPLATISIGALLGMLLKNDFLTAFSEQAHNQSDSTRNSFSKTEQKFLKKAGILGIIAGLALQWTPVLAMLPGAANLLFVPIYGTMIMISVTFDLFLGLPLAQGAEVLTMRVTQPCLILWRFRTILCQHCFRYTVPLRSRYVNGTRYCEHCESEVEDTRDPGRLIFVFGIVLDKPAHIRQFLLSNPDVTTRTMPFDVSEVYIDTKTCNLILLERFITHILNYPPKHGISSVTIFYQGMLDNLGDHLKNVLCNNFVKLHQISHKYETASIA
jgi:hypothetical protein